MKNNKGLFPYIWYFAGFPTPATSRLTPPIALCCVHVYHPISSKLQLYYNYVYHIHENTIKVCRNRDGVKWRG